MNERYITYLKILILILILTICFLTIYNYDTIVENREIENKDIQPNMSKNSTYKHICIILDKFSQCAWYQNPKLYVDGERIDIGN